MVIGVVVFFEWFVTNTNYQQAVKQYRQSRGGRRSARKHRGAPPSGGTPPQSPRQKKKQDRSLGRSKFAQELAAAGEDEDAADEELVIIGADGKQVLPYSFRRSMLVELLRMPFDGLADIKWSVEWFIRYTVLKKPYSRAAREYLTYTTLMLERSAWELMPEEERSMLVEKELWVEENLLKYASKGSVLGKGLSSVSTASLTAGLRTKSLSAINLSRTIGSVSASLPKSRMATAAAEPASAGAAN